LALVALAAALVDGQPGRKMDDMDAPSVPDFVKKVGEE
jgi:hypothetical protein